MLTISQLCKRFDRLCVLDRFDLAVPRNGFTVLIGPSGCGKTTLFDALTGVFVKDAGEIRWLEEPLPHLGQRSAYMQQKDLLLPWLSLLKNAMLPAEMAGADPQTARQKAVALFARLGLAGFENHMPRETSGGMRQRCALVRTLMFEHELVLLDEPLSGLDAITRRRLQGLFLMLQRDFGKTILMITHDIEEALYLADELVVLGRSPMRILHRIVLDSPKPRRLDAPELIALKTVVMERMQAEMNHAP